jgi:hypothetical protein
MDAVVDDHGVWDEPADYYASARYRNRPGFFKLWLYRLLVGGINRRVRAIRGTLARDPHTDAAENRPQPQA